MKTQTHSHPAPIHRAASIRLCRKLSSGPALTSATLSRAISSVSAGDYFPAARGNAALAILKRFIALFPGRRFPVAGEVVAIPIARMRKAGLSRAKAMYIKGLAAHVVAKKVNFHRFPKMDDEAIITELTAVKGIGRWTAEMFLMFNMGRPT